MKNVVDNDGYRPNVGIILCNHDNRVLWARRIGEEAWQFPQGGIRRNESAQQAMYRELWEEVGLRPRHVNLLGCTRGWLKYSVPRSLRRCDQFPPYVGQKQIWYLLRFSGDEQDVKLDRSQKPEFDGWRWVEYWYPLREVVAFKRDVYKRALSEFAPLIGSSDLK